MFSLCIILLFLSVPIRFKVAEIYSEGNYDSIPQLISIFVILSTLDLFCLSQFIEH